MSLPSAFVLDTLIPSISVFFTKSNYPDSYVGYMGVTNRHSNDVYIPLNLIYNIVGNSQFLLNGIDNSFFTEKFTFKSIAFSLNECARTVHAEYPNASQIPHIETYISGIIKDIDDVEYVTLGTVTLFFTKFITHARNKYPELADEIELIYIRYADLITGVATCRDLYTMRESWSAFGGFDDSFKDILNRIRIATVNQHIEETGSIPVLGVLNTLIDDNIYPKITKVIKRELAENGIIRLRKNKTNDVEEIRIIRNKVAKKVTYGRGVVTIDSDELFADTKLVKCITTNILKMVYTMNNYNYDYTSYTHQE